MYYNYIILIIFGKINHKANLCYVIMFNHTFIRMKNKKLVTERCE